MALPADYITGTITLTNGSVDFTGTDTGWLAADFREGDTIPYVAGGESFAPPIIATITSNTAGTLTTPWAGPTLTGVAYRMRYQWDSSRVSAQTRTMIEQLGNGNLQSISALTGPGVLVFDGPHSTVVRPETDFINGVAYDVQVDTLADRAAYDGQATGFSVLVSNVGDGRSAVYSKNSNTVGDWSDPAYITGPVGPTVTFEAGTTTTLPPGSAATADVVPVTGGYELNLGIPEGEGFNWAGVYNIANAYNQDDVVRHNRSAFIALQAVPVGESPSSAYPPVDTAYWQALVIAGQNGTGTGTVVGPASAIANNLALWDGTTGELIKDGGLPTTVLPQGRVTLTAGVAVPISDVVNATQIHYVPAVGDRIPLWDAVGGRFRTYSIGTGLSMTLDPDPAHTGYHEAGKQYDLWVFNDAGTLRLCTGPAWTGDNARATALTQLNGMWVNSAPLSVRFGSLAANTATVAANSAVLVGAFRAQTGGGTATDALNRRTIDNVYNKVYRPLVIRGSGVSYVYNTSAWRLTGGSTDSIGSIIQAMPGGLVRGSVSAANTENSAGFPRSLFSSIGVNTTTSNSATQLQPGYANGAGLIRVPAMAEYIGYPGIGRTTFNWIEFASAAGGETITWSNTADSGMFLEVPL